MLLAERVEVSQFIACSLGYIFPAQHVHLQNEESLEHAKGLVMGDIVSHITDIADRVVVLVNAVGFLSPVPRVDMTKTFNNLLSRMVKNYEKNKSHQLSATELFDSVFFYEPNNPDCQLSYSREVLLSAFSEFKKAEDLLPKEWNALAFLIQGAKALPSD